MALLPLPPIPSLVMVGGVALGTFFATTVAGLTGAQLLQFNTAVNLALFALVLQNRAQISELSGRYDADHGD